MSIDVDDPLLQPAGAVRFLNAARSDRAIKSWGLDLRLNGDQVRFYVVVVTFRRRADGTLSTTRRGEILYTDPELSPDVALVEAALWVRDNVPEASP